jgi:dipeptide/tripeptide permease
LSFSSALSFVGLFLIAVGTGGIKPCVASFGGEQFKLPEQQVGRDQSRDGDLKLKEMSP